MISAVRIAQMNAAMAVSKTVTTDLQLHKQCKKQTFCTRWKLVIPKWMTIIDDNEHQGSISCSPPTLVVLRQQTYSFFDQGI